MIQHIIEVTATARAREIAGRITESAAFQQFIVVVIAVNAITLGLETSEAVMASVGPLLVMVDRLALMIFIVEIALKLVAQGRRFFTSGWNLFDLGIVVIALLPTAGGLSVLRALRIIRVTRLFSIVPGLRMIIQALIGAIPGMTSIVLVLGLIFYICAVVATKLFGEQFPDRFGGLDVSALTLFQLMTLDGWSAEIVLPVLAVYPWSWVFFIPFIVVTSFAVLNLFIGVLMSNIESQQEEREVERDETMRHSIEDLAVELHEIRALLREQLARPPSAD